MLENISQNHRVSGLFELHIVVVASKAAHTVCLASTGTRRESIVEFSD